MNLSCSLASSPVGAQSLPTCSLNPANVTRNPAQPGESGEFGIPAFVVDLIGGGGRDRTADIWVMNPIEINDSKKDNEVISAESGELWQDLQPPRNLNSDSS